MPGAKNSTLVGAADPRACTTASHCKTPFALDHTRSIPSEETVAVASSVAARAVTRSPAPHHPHVRTRAQPRTQPHTKTTHIHTHIQPHNHNQHTHTHTHNQSHTNHTINHTQKPHTHTHTTTHTTTHTHTQPHTHTHTHTHPHTHTQPHTHNHTHTTTRTTTHNHTHARTHKAATLRRAQRTSSQNMAPIDGTIAHREARDDTLLRPHQDGLLEERGGARRTNVRLAPLKCTHLLLEYGRRNPGQRRRDKQQDSSCPRHHLRNHVLFGARDCRRLLELNLGACPVLGTYRRLGTCP